MGDSRHAILSFGISLAPMRTADEWIFRGRMLSATLTSLYRQTDPDFHIFVAGDLLPALDVPLDQRFTFIKARSLNGNSAGAADVDQGNKIALMAQRVAATGGGYFMPLDMDDLVSRRLTAYVRATQDPNGYLIARGYVFDARANLISPLPGEADTKHRFDLTCGSSAVFRLAPEDMSNHDDGTRGRFHELRKTGHVSVGPGAVAEGRPFHDIPFRAAVWVVNHGVNLSLQAGLEQASRAEGWRRLLAGVAEHGKAPDAGLREEFAIPDRYPLPDDDVSPPPSEHPTLTVAISTHRRPAGLRRLLAALRPQLLGSPGRDIVVVNDGTHDDAYQAVFLEFRDIIRYRALPTNVGVAAARNAAAALAGGDYLVFTDDDCEPPSWWLDWLEARLKRAPELDVVAGPTEPLWPAGKRSFMARVQAHHGLIPQAYRSDGAVIFATANVAIRRSLFESVGGFGFPGKFHGASEDTELSSRLSLAGASMLVDPGWRVRHEVGEPFRALRRRYWRYGYANGAMTKLTSSPASNDGLAWRSRRAGPRDWQATFRETREKSAGFSRRRSERLLATLIGTAVRIAYLDGAAQAIREASGE